MKLVNYVKCLLFGHQWFFHNCFFSETKEFYSCTVKCERCLTENTKVHDMRINNEKKEEFGKGAKKV